MFRFVKQIAISALMLFNSLLSVNSLECIAMKNQECKVRPEIVDINSNNPFNILLVLRQIKAVVIAITLTIHMQEFVFQIL